MLYACEKLLYVCEKKNINNKNIIFFIALFATLFTFLGHMPLHDFLSFLFRSMCSNRLFSGDSKPNYAYFLSCDAIRDSWNETADLTLANFLKLHSRPGVTGPLKEDIEPGWRHIIAGMQMDTGNTYTVDELKCAIDSVTRQIYHNICNNRKGQHPDLWLAAKVSLKK